MIRVVLADDHHLVRTGIRALLEKAGDIEVIGEAADGQAAVELVEQLQPDVLVIDIAMPRLTGIQALGRVRSMGNDTRVVILSMHSGAPLVRQALRAGAIGYLLKHSVSEELLLAIRAASRGEVYLSPPVSGIVMDGYLDQQAAGPTADPLEQLTSREREVLHLIAEGHTNNEISELMNISINTVEKHRANLMTKLDIHDVAGLTLFAIKHGLIFLE
jgi:DNA-binding NarL/FixJ family response regulator